MDINKTDELERALADREAALRELRSRYRQLVDVLEEAVCLLEADGVLRYLNAAAERLFARPAERLLGHHLGEFIEADDWRRLEDTMQVAGRGEAISLRVRLLREPGLRWCDCTLTPGVAPGDGEVQLAMLCRDAGVQSETGAELAESLEIYRQMFQRSPALKLLIDPRDGRIVDTNEATAAFYGYSVAQLKQLHIWSLNIAGQAEVMEKMQRAIGNQQRFFTSRHRTASGSLRDVEVYSCPVRVGGREYLHAIIHDTTDRNRFSRALEDQRQFIEDAIDSLPGPFFLINAAGRFVLWNDYFENQLGYSSAEMARATPATFLPAAAHERAMAAFEAAFAGGILDIEASVLDRAGSRKVFYLSGRRLEHGEPLLVGMGVDITARREVEREHERLLAMLESVPYLGGYTDTDR